MKQVNLACVLLLVLAPFATPAQPMLSNEDCDVLEKLVKRHVWLAATEIRIRPAKRSLRLADTGLARRHICRRTPEVTTRAFGEALAALNMSIFREPPNTGDYCSSGDLDQCYPGRMPDQPHLPGTRLAFVYDAWQGVRDAVQAHVKAGSGGVALFSGASLDAALNRSLAESVEGPLHARYRSSKDPACGSRFHMARSGDAAACMRSRSTAQVPASVGPTSRAWRVAFHRPCPRREPE